MPWALLKGGGPGGEEEVLGVLLQAAVAAARCCWSRRARAASPGRWRPGRVPRPPGPQRGSRRAAAPPAGRPLQLRPPLNPAVPALPASRPGSWRGWGPEPPSATPPPGPRPRPSPAPCAPRAPPREAWDQPQGGLVTPGAGGSGDYVAGLFHERCSSRAVFGGAPASLLRRLRLCFGSLPQPPGNCQFLGDQCPRKARLARVWGRAQAEPETFSAVSALLASPGVRR